VGRKPTFTAEDVASIPIMRERKSVLVAAMAKPQRKGLILGRKSEKKIIL
jgi:hypothetical protein